MAWIFGVVGAAGVAGVPALIAAGEYGMAAAGAVVGLLMIALAWAMR